MEMSHTHNKSPRSRVLAKGLAFLVSFAIAPMAVAQQSEPGSDHTQDECFTFFNEFLGEEVRECPSQSETATSTRAQTFDFISNLGTRISQQRQQNRGNNPSTASTRPMLGGAAGGGDLGGRLSPFITFDKAEAERDETSAGQGYDQDSDSVILGADYRLTDSLFVGATLNYLTGDTDFDRNSGSTDVDVYILGLHASKYWANDVFLDALVTYGQLDLDIERTDAFGDRYKASTDGDLHSAEVAVGRNFSVNRWRITPRVRVLHLRGELDGYTEDVVAASFPAPQTVEEQPFDALNYEFSLQLDYVLLFDWGVLIPTANLAYQHEHTDTDVTRGTTNFGGGFTGQFAQQTDDPDKNVKVARVGASAQFKRGWSAFLSYEELIDHEFIDRYNAVLGVRYEIP